MSSVLIKTFSVGRGDMSYVRHRNGDVTVVDCCLGDRSAEIRKEIKSRQSGDKPVVRFVSTHPESDHIGGLADLEKEFSPLDFWRVGNAIPIGATADNDCYCALRDGPNAFDVYKGKYITRDKRHTGITFLWPSVANTDFKKALQIANAGGSADNISPIVKYTESDGVRVMWMGDMSGGFLEKIKAEVEWDAVDVLFAPHHGRDRVPPDVLAALNPKMIVIGEADRNDLEYYKKYPQICQNTAGDILFVSYNGYVHVYTSQAVNQSAAVFLKPNKDGKDWSRSEVYRGYFKTYALECHEEST